MATKNLYAKRLLLVDKLIKLNYQVSIQKPSPRKKIYLLTKDDVQYRLDFDREWLAINQDKDRLFCGVNLVSGKKLASCMDNHLTKLFTDVVTILYQHTNIQSPTTIL